MPISEKQLAANRANALRSTGPRTPKGKAVSSRNALKHGLRAMDLVVATTNETEEEFDDLLQRLTSELAPQGIREEFLVSQIAAHSWRLRRVFRAEAAEIEGARRDALSALERKRDPESALQDMFEAENVPVYGPALAQKARKILASSPQGLLHVRGILQEVRREIAATGALSSDGLRLLAVLLDRGDELLCLARARVLPSDGPPSAPHPDVTDLTAALDRRIAETATQLETVEREDARERLALLDRHSLPAAGAADKLLRYEKTIQNALYRAMRELDRLQTCRLQSSGGHS